MVPFLVTLLMMAPVGGSVGEARSFMLRDPQQGPTPVSDKYLIPERAPTCATPEQIQHARVEIIKGYEPECMIPRNSDEDKPR